MVLFLATILEFQVCLVFTNTILYVSCLVLASFFICYNLKQNDSVLFQVTMKVG